LKTTSPGFSATFERHCPPKEHEADWDLKALKDAIFTRFGVDIYAEGLKPEEMNRQELGDAIFDKLKERYDAKEALIGAEAMRYHERMIMLSVIDAQWKDHLLSMDHLKEGIGLRGYGQHDPLVEYKRESFDMFEEMMQRFQEETVRYLYLMQIMERPPDAGARPGGGSPTRSVRPGGRCGRAFGHYRRSRRQRTPATPNGYVRGRNRRSLPAQEKEGTGTSAHGRGGRHAGAAGGALGRESRAQRSLSLRKREEI
jgi:preprotein translocase subunit SecA